MSTTFGHFQYTTLFCIALTCISSDASNVHFTLHHNSLANTDVWGVSSSVESGLPSTSSLYNSLMRHLLLNLRGPRDCPSSVVPSSVASSSVRACGTSLVRWMALQCANRTSSSSGQPRQASEALGSLLHVRCRHRSAKSTAVSSKTFLFQVTHIYLFCGSVTLST